MIETPEIITRGGKAYRCREADTRPFGWLPESDAWICGTIPRESHGEMFFRLNALLKQGGMPSDVLYSDLFENLIANLGEGEGLDSDSWHTGRVWLDAQVVNCWEVPPEEDLIVEILRNLEVKPENFVLQVRDDGMLPDSRKFKTI